MSPDGGLVAGVSGGGDRPAPPSYLPHSRVYGAGGVLVDRVRVILRSVHGVAGYAHVRLHSGPASRTTAATRWRTTSATCWRPAAAGLPEDLRLPPAEGDRHRRPGCDRPRRRHHFVHHRPLLRLRTGARRGRERPNRDPAVACPPAHRLDPADRRLPGAVAGDHVPLLPLLRLAGEHPGERERDRHRACVRVQHRGRHRHVGRHPGGDLRGAVEPRLQGAGPGEGRTALRDRPALERVQQPAGGRRRGVGRRRPGAPDLRPRAARPEAPSGRHDHHRLPPLLRTGERGGGDGSCGSGGVSNRSREPPLLSPRTGDQVPLVQAAGVPVPGPVHGGRDATSSPRSATCPSR